MLNLDLRSFCKWALVLRDQQNRGKRSVHLMDTVNTKKRWTNIYWCVNKFLKESYIVTHHENGRASFLKINDINDIFLERLTVVIVVL
jgi:hypothetical protein